MERKKKMADYIEREALLEAIDKAFNESPIEDTTAWLVGRRIVRTSPAADVSKVRHSWLEKPTELSERVCHLCRKSPKMIFGVLPDYCPHCGAIFDGKESGNG